MVKKLEFEHYVHTLLKFMSYTDNRYKVTAREREAVAKVYYCCFIGPSGDPAPKGRALLTEVVRHISEWCLQSESLTRQPALFVLVVFLLYDYMFMLDLVAESGFYVWAERVFAHGSFSLMCRRLFVHRVH